MTVPETETVLVPVPVAVTAPGLRAFLVVMAMVALAMTASPAHAASAITSEDAEDRQRNELREQDRAAEYRLGRKLYHAGADDDQRIATYVAQCEALLSTGRTQPLESWIGGLHLWSIGSRTSNLAGFGIAELPYAKRIGDLYLLQVKGNARASSPGGMLLALQRMWYRLPDYDRTTEAFAIAITALERMIDFTQSVDLNAANPTDVVNTSGDSIRFSTGGALDFLIKYGDRETVSPRARLAAARTLLLDGDRASLFAARLAYQDFLANHPDHALTFSVLCELALTHLGTYRGEEYDAGALVQAALWIDQAELLTKGDAEKITTIQAYRSRLRSWQQDRDLSIARWYRLRGQPAWMSALRMPLGLQNWQGGAEFYYRQAIGRDPASTQARQATAELTELLRTAPPAPSAAIAPGAGAAPAAAP